VGAGLTLWPDFPLLKVTIASQVVNGAVLPFVLIFMLLLVNKPALMGDHTNTRLFDIVAWVTAGVLILLTAGYLWTLFT